MSEPAELKFRQWSASQEDGRTEITLSARGVLVELTDDDTQRRYSKVLPLAEYASEVPTDGWTPVRKIVANNFSESERAEIEAYLAELLNPPS